MTFKLSTILASLILLTACQTAPYKTEYTLGSDLTANVPVSQKQKPYSVIVNDVKTFGSGAEVNMTYTRTPNVIEAYTKSEWVEPPVLLIKTALTNALIASNNYQDVLMSPTSIMSPYRIDAVIQNMQQVFVGDKSYIELSLMVRLVDTVNQKLVFSKIYSTTEAVETLNAEGGVEAYNKAMKKLLPNIVQDLSRY